jgi:hypothetical protein
LVRSVNDVVVAASRMVYPQSFSGYFSPNTLSNVASATLYAKWKIPYLCVQIFLISTQCVWRIDNASPLD